jgi:hypothetical protein
MSQEQQMRSDARQHPERAAGNQSGDDADQRRHRAFHSCRNRQLARSQPEQRVDHQYDADALPQYARNCLNTFLPPTADP